MMCHKLQVKDPLKVGTSALIPPHDLMSLTLDVDGITNDVFSKGESFNS